MEKDGRARPPPDQSEGTNHGAPAPFTECHPRGPPATYLSIAGVGPVLLQPRHDVPGGRREPSHEAGRHCCGLGPAEALCSIPPRDCPQCWEDREPAGMGLPHHTPTPGHCRVARWPAALTPSSQAGLSRVVNLKTEEPRLSDWLCISYKPSEMVQKRHTGPGAGVCWNTVPGMALPRPATAQNSPPTPVLAPPPAGQTLSGHKAQQVHPGKQWDPRKWREFAALFQVATASAAATSPGGPGPLKAHLGLPRMLRPGA